MAVVKKLHGPSVHPPAEQALLLMQSIFAPKVGHEEIHGDQVVGPV
jgi:hypothetical protein